ncbi:MAG: hypothetical protein QG641_320, partial [Candidatus Poribacteria bacterium]|nr:hypothetical protein [Candidatus Poribacteria bacterium]
YFKEFIEFFFPQAYSDIDWSNKYESLDTELQQIVQDSELGKRMVDKLVKVYLKDGKESWILIHVEVQSQREIDFAKRMYIYNYRIFDRHDRFVISLAVLGDEHPSWKPNRFGYDMWGFKVGIEFPVIKLLDYRDRWDELEKSRNPFAVVVMAHLKTQETSKNNEDRKRWKFYLAKLLYERGYEKEDIIQLLRFIDWIMRLPEDLNISFWREVRQLEEGKSMPYLSSFEQMAIKRGMEEGKQQEVLCLLIQILNIKFKEIPRNIIEKLEKITDTYVLEILHSHAVLCDSIEDFEKKTNDIVPKEN